MVQLAKAHSIVTKKAGNSMPILKEVYANGKLQSTNLDCWLFTENPSSLDGGYYIKGNSFYKNETKIDEFPLLELGEKLYSLPVADFLPSIFEASNLVSKDSMRPAMQSVLLRLAENHIKVVSTNGHYLYHRKFNGENLSLFDILLPGESVKVLKQLFSLFKPSQVEMQIFKRNYEKSVICYAKFLFSNIEFVIRLCDESFPRFEDVVPLDFENKIIFKTDELLTKTKSIQEMLDNKTDQIVFIFEPDSTYSVNGYNNLLNIRKKENTNSLVYYSGLKGIQDNFVLLMPVRIKDENLKPENIAFNCQYLIDCLKVIKSDNVTIHWNANTKAVLLIG